jgi:hypothetical protein
LKPPGVSGLSLVWKSWKIGSNEGKKQVLPDKIGVNQQKIKVHPTKDEDSHKKKLNSSKKQKRIIINQLSCINSQ